MVGMAVVVAHDVEAFRARGALHADEVLGRDLVAHGGPLRLAVRRRDRARHPHRAVARGADEDAAHLVRIAGPRVRGDRVRLRARDLQRAACALR